MTGYDRARPSGHWVDYPDTTYGTVGTAEFEKWDAAVYDLKSRVFSLTDFYTGSSQPADVLGYVQDGLTKSANEGGVLLIPDSEEPWVVGAGICPPPNSRMIGSADVRFSERLSSAGHGTNSYNLPVVGKPLGESWIQLASGANCPILYNDYTNAVGNRGPLRSSNKYWQWFSARGIVFDHNGKNQSGALRAIDIRQAWGMNFSYCRVVSPRGQGFVFDTCNECHGEKVSALGDFEATSNGTGNTTSGSATILGANGTWAVGDWIVGSGIPDATYVSAVSGTTLTLAKQADATSATATATATGVSLSKWVPIATSLLSLISSTDSEWIGFDGHAASYATVRLDSAFGTRVSGLAGFTIGGCNLVLEDNAGTGCFENKIDMRLDQASHHNARIGTGCYENEIDVQAWMPGLYNVAADSDGGWATVFCDGNGNVLRGTGRRRLTAVSNMSCVVRYGSNAQDNKGYLTGGSDMAGTTQLYQWNGAESATKTYSNSSPVPGWFLLPGYSFRAADGTTPAETTFNGTLHKVMGMANSVDSSAICYFTVPNGCRAILVRLELVNLDSSKSGNVRLQAGLADALGLGGDTLGGDETTLGPATVAFAASNNTVSTSFSGTQPFVHPGQIMCVRVKRVGTNIADTLAASIGLLAVRIEPLLVV